ncbi:MAG TPA: carboxypeptidase-like regulatory domain-containing protein, partial [Segetibacter sp.]
MTFFKPNFKLTTMGCFLKRRPFQHLQKHSERLSKNFLLLLILTLSFQWVTAQTRMIKGRVTSGDTALSNITVQVKGTTTSTQTDEGGNFTISATPNATLVFTSVGYGREEVNVSNRTSVDVRLQSTTAQLEQVVVVGYGTQRRR